MQPQFLKNAVSAKAVVTLMGATASGKTRLAMALYKKYPQAFSLINVDSALIYKDMDIGTAKPTAEELEQAPHALVSFVDPADSYNVGSFKRDVEKLIAQIHTAGKIPVLVGGTMLYYRSLLGELDSLPASTPESRQWVTDLQQTYGKEFCHRLLAQIDPPSYTRLNPNDGQRVGRVLEVYYLTGKGISQISNNNSSVSKNLSPLAKSERLRKINKQLFNTPHYNLENYLVDFEELDAGSSLAPKNAQGLYEYLDTKGNSFESKYNLVQFAMYNQDREALHQDIANRLKEMLAMGFEQEVRNLYERGDLRIDMPSIRCVGYRQLWGYFDGEDTYEEAVDKILFATRQLAKRQITWLRSWPLPFTQIPTYLSVDQQIAIIEKVLGFIKADVE